jgi:hypothetical protein
MTTLVPTKGGDVVTGVTIDGSMIATGYRSA